MKPHSSRQFMKVVWNNKFVKSYLMYGETALFDFSEMQTTPHGVPEVGLKSLGRYAPRFFISNFYSMLKEENGDFRSTSILLVIH
jgi:hypothetical protein